MIPNLPKRVVLQRPVEQKSLLLYIAYTDDMLDMAKDAGTLQALLPLFNNLASRIGLLFNSHKGLIMNYSYKSPAGCRDPVFNINNSEIPYICDGGPAVFFGKPIGAFLPKHTVTVDQLKQRSANIMA